MVVAKPVSIRFDKSGFARNRQLTDSLKDFKESKKSEFSTTHWSKIPLFTMINKIEQV